MQQALRVVNLPIPNTSRFVPPLIEEVIAYGSEIGLPQVECERLWHYYTSQDWNVGKVKMKVWRSAVAGWKLRWQERTKSQILSKLEPSFNVLILGWRDELKRVEEAMRKLKGAHWTDNAGWDDRDSRKRHNDLAVRKQELIKKLGWQA